MMKNLKKYSGFTLIEIAIVLIIVTVLLGYTMAMIPVQQDLKQYKKADAQMNKIIDSLYAFAQVNGYLPCPANDNVASSGFECRDGDGVENGNCGGAVTQSCDLWFGYVPGKTLGLEGSYSAVSGLLLDPWGKPYRYQVTQADNEDNDDDGVGEGNGIADFVIQNGIQITANSHASNPSLELSLLSPDLVVCNSVAAVTATNCSGAPTRIVSEIPAVIFSTGKNIGNSTSVLEVENTDGGDNVFVKALRGDNFDDLVKWISPNTLYSKMIEAGQLP